MNKVDVKIAKFKDDAIIPNYATLGSACFDLVAIEDIIIPPSATAIIPTGLVVEVPEGYKLSIYARSGISAKYPLIIGNGVGQVDSDYRGEVGVIIKNIGVFSPYPVNFAITLEGKPMEIDRNVPVGSFIIRKGDRIAQGAIEVALQAEFTEIDATKVSETERGTGGFGSSGVK